MNKYEILEEQREEKRRERLDAYFNAWILELLAQSQEESMARFRREVQINSCKARAKYLTITSK